MKVKLSLFLALFTVFQLFSQEPIGNNLYYNGVDEYVDAGQDRKFRPGTITIEAWIKPNGLNNSEEILRNFDDGSMTGYVLSYNDNTLKLWVGTSSGVINTDPYGITITDNTWQHVAFTFDKKNIKEYKDGVEVSNVNFFSNKDKESIDYGNVGDLSGLIIGGGGSDYNGEGRIDEVRIWSKVLTVSQLDLMKNYEIEQDGSNDAVRLVGTTTVVPNIKWSNLRVYYKFNEDDIQGEVLDYSQYGNNAIYVGMDDANIGDPESGIRIETVQPGSWVATSTWKDNIAPSTNDVVYIKDEITIDGDKTVQQAYINSDITIKSGRTVTVTKQINLSSNIIIEEGGSLIQSEGSTLNENGGKVISYRTDAVNEYKYQYWSSPVHDTSNEYKISDSWTVGNGVNHDSRWIYMLKGSWEKLDENTVIPAGFGFTIKPEIGGGSEQIVFDGIPNNGDVVVDVSSVPNGQYVIIGNPYPSAIKASDFITDIVASGVSDGTVYIWDSTGNSDSHYQRSGSGYATVTSATTTSASEGGSTPSGYISTGQGFLIKVIDNTKNVIFKNSHRKASNNTQFYKKSSSENTLLRINLKGNQDNFSQAAIVFDNESTAEFDKGYDAIAIKSYNTNIHSKISNQEFVINSLPKSSLEETIELGVETGDLIPFTISLSESANIEEGVEVLLKDNLLGINTDLRNSDYEFTPDRTNQKHDNRFSIELVQQTLDVNDDVVNDITWSVKNNILFIRSNSILKKSKLNITDMNGRIVKSDLIDGSHNMVSVSIEELNSGVYIFSIDNEGAVFSKKFKK